MSVKHVKEYYESVFNDYHEMIQTLKDMEEECTKGLVSPDRVDQLKKMIEPIKLNYGRLSYIMFLLNEPNKKEKQKWYFKENKNKKFPVEYTAEGVKQENKDALDEARKLI